MRLNTGKVEKIQWLMPYPGKSLIILKLSSTNSLMALTTAKPFWMEELQLSYTVDAQYPDLVSILLLHLSQQDSNYQLV